MNKELREKLKEAQVRCRRLGYSLELLMGDLYLRKVKAETNTPDKFVKILVRASTKQSIKNPSGAYTVEFVAIPTGESSLMLTTFGVMESVCKFWDRVLKECKELNDMKITGTFQEFNECMTDILNRSRV